ncbi:MAG TPA: crosslink repair DNA glycosylase YcaQ family protein [Streptosporangiaceae bacterium]|nr:crosslink repair DNA glycosylase YcaQ family protein [Streptosporangiaceae bacterium]
MKTPALPTITWEQALTWRLHRHGLDVRSADLDLMEMTERLCGVHAQVLSCAELMLAIRVGDQTMQSVRSALWDQHALVKTWVMRGTLHLLTSRSLPRYAATMHAGPIYWTADGVTVTEQDVRLVASAVGTVLRGRVMTRAELAGALCAELARPDLAEVLTHGFGPLLKPAALAGDLCFGADRGRNVTFTHPADWAAQAWAQRPPAPAAAQQAVLRDFLFGYGPSLPKDIQRWWGTTRLPITHTRADLGDEVAEVCVEGRTCWLLHRDLESVRALAPSRRIRLLGGFDQYTVTLPQRVEALLPKAARPLVYRTAGWISPVVTAGPAIVGVWRAPQRASDPLQVRLLRPLDAGERAQLTEEAALVAGLLHTSPELAIESG